MKSTGPNTSEGKLRSRRNAVRHGLTAETVIDALEDSSDYRAFELAICADYNARSAVERELVLRLASLLWRLRRATAMETGLFELQAKNLDHDCEYDHTTPDLINTVMVGEQSWNPSHVFSSAQNKNIELAKNLLGLADLPNRALDKLSRYETLLSRQVSKILSSLGSSHVRQLGERKDDPLVRRRITPFR